MPIRKQPPECGETRDAAETIAITVFAHLASEPEELQRFLALTGIQPENVRDAARQPGFFAAVLDYVLNGSRSLAAVEAATGLGPQTLAQARERLVDDRFEHST